MKVYIGPYRNWLGPYQLADYLQKIGVSEDTCEKIGDWLCDTPIEKFLIWFDRRKKRKIKIHIDRWDTWSADHTLALIILPMLKQIKESKHGAPQVDNEDVPEELRDNAEEQTKFNNTGHPSDKFFERWDYILDRMIYSFEHVLDTEWESEYFSNGQYNREGYMARKEKIQNGLTLFGKYFQSLWT